MSVQLNQKIYQETDAHFLISRAFSSLKTVQKKRGIVKSALMGTTMVVSKVFTSAICYFCLDGSVRALNEIQFDNRHITNLRYLGDAGGWTAIVLFSIVTLGTLSIQLIREGEYLKLNELCIEWMKENKEFLSEEGRLNNTFYTSFNDLVDLLSSECAFKKNVISRRLKAIKIIEKSGIAISSSLYNKDVALVEVFKNIQSDLKETSCGETFANIKKAQQSIRQGSYLRQTGALTLGIVVPVLLFSTALISIIGEVGLGHELFIEKKEQGDMGHFGEWPVNAVEAIGIAYLLYKWVIINEAKFVRTREVYQEHIHAISYSKRLHNRLCVIANQHLSELAAECQYLKYPNYKFELL